MSNETKQVIKRHLISFVITFGATFLLTIYPALEQANWELSILGGIAIATARASFKLAWEFAVIPLLSLIKTKAGNLKK